MNDVLKTAMIRYYDFMTAYQNLLRDKDTEAEISVSLNCTDAARNLSLNACAAAEVCHHCICQECKWQASHSSAQLPQCG